MRMFDINGDLVNVDIRGSRYPIKSQSRSSLQGQVAHCLSEKFPRQAVLEDFTVPGSRLSVDFFLPGLGIIIEVDGIQHEEYTPFFHGNKNELKFAKQINRDIKKEQWCLNNDFTLIRIKKNQDIELLNNLAY